MTVPRKISKQHRRRGARVGRARASAAVTAKAKAVSLRRERDEAIEQQKAMSEILLVIAGSPGELAPVFQSILVHAVRLCSAKFGNLLLREGNGFRISVTHGAPAKYRQYLQREPLRRRIPNNPVDRINKNSKTDSYSRHQSGADLRRQNKGRGSVEPAVGPRRRATPDPSAAQSRRQCNQIHPGISRTDQIISFRNISRPTIP
jgi:hypothetical protein